LRNISQGLRDHRRHQLGILVGNYKKALKNAKDDTTKGILKGLIEKAENEIKTLK
jgi:hypothetical protein